MANNYGLVLPPPPVKRGPGQPTKYRQLVVDTILNALEIGAPESIAFKEAGVSGFSFYEWKNQYPEFSKAVDAAKAASHLAIIASVKKSVHGYPCQRCTDGTEILLSKDGEEREVKCPACNGTQFAVKPDGKLGLTLLERRLPKEYGKVNTTDVRVTGGVTVSHVAARVELETLDAVQLADLAWDEDEEDEDEDQQPLMIEAEQ